jgi:hypothetical protein
MDNNQIKLYIEHNIKSKEPGLESDPRLAFELKQFTEALCSRSGQLAAPTPQQIEQAWERWKLERFHYVQHVQTYAKENAVNLEKFAEEQILLAHPKAKEDSRLAHEIGEFKKNYATRLEHLGKQPLPEHVLMAWKAWLTGFRF